MKPMRNDYRPELYLALETQRVEQQILQSLSTEVMRWTDDVWIMDLSRYYDYWIKQSNYAGLHPLSLWRKLFNHLLGEEPEDPASKVIALAPSYRASCARNPWSAALLLQAMRERGVKGIISLDSKTGQSLFQEISWTSWWQQLTVLESHLSCSKIRGYKEASFKQQCKRLQLAIPRLDFKRPWAMRILNREGVKKRFGTVLADTWEWSYGKGTVDFHSLPQSGFPWKPWMFGDPPYSRRNLDYPLLLWDQFVPLLVEDFDKFCKIIGNTGERITRIDWTLTFENMKQMTVPILFRNPHNLQEEKGKHTTSLLQANYGFVDAVQQCFPPDPEGGAYETMPLVVSWELQIISSLYLPDIVLDIFGEGQEKGRELEILLRLENELPVSLHRFSLLEDWYPEDSFAAEHFETDMIAPASPEIKLSLEALAEERPLFIRRTPSPVQKTGKLRSSRFLESTMIKWWKDHEMNEKERSYFKQIDLEGNAFWVFRDVAGQWYQHGVFG